MENISIKAQEIFEIGGFGITNSLILTLIVSFILIFSSFLIRSRIRIIPGKFQSAMEMSMEWLLDLIGSTIGSKKRLENYFPIVATIFVFILTANLLGLFPGIGSLFFEKSGHKIPLLRSPAADLNFTIAFALISVVSTNIFGMMAVGFMPHIKKFLNFKNPILFFIGILEFVSEIAKIISLSFRLFGNVFAGEVLLMIIFFLVPYFIPLPFLILEFFVGLIQAFLFAMLTLVSIALHTATHEH